MTVEIGVATGEDICRVAMAARAVDRRELLASFHDESMAEVARRTALMVNAHEGVAFCLRRNGVPVAVMGWVFVNPNCASLWAFATDELPRVGLSFTRFCKAAIAELLHNRPCRLQALTADFHRESHRWLETLGLRRESTLTEYGANGEDFHLYVRIRQ